LVQAGIIPDVARELEKKKAAKQAAFSLSGLPPYANTQQKPAKLVGMSFTICQNCKLLMSKKDHIFG
jgi:hypothetical protein